MNTGLSLYQVTALALNTSTMEIFFLVGNTQVSTGGEVWKLTSNSDLQAVAQIMCVVTGHRFSPFTTEDTYSDKTPTMDICRGFLYYIRRASLATDERSTFPTLQNLRDVNLISWCESLNWVLLTRDSTSLRFGEDKDKLPLSGEDSARTILALLTVITGQSFEKAPTGTFHPSEDGRVCYIRNDHPSVSSTAPAIKPTL